MSIFNPKEIICPVCNIIVGHYDGRSTIDKNCRCNKCKKIVTFHVKNGTVEIKDRYQRTCASGTRFY